MTIVYVFFSMMFIFSGTINANPLEKIRHTLDLSVRTVKTAENDPAQLAFVGLDLHRVVSTSSEDRATLTLQPYLAFVQNGSAQWDTPPQKHPLFDGSNDWAIQWRNFNANFKILQNGSLNVRLGHIEVPFGIEYPIDTNGRALDYAHGANFVGIKADWGASLNGITGGYEYELAFLRGSGNGYESESISGETPYFISGRIGTDRNADVGIGLSALRGNLLTPSRDLVERRRFALDAQYYLRNFAVLGEVAAGSNGGLSTDTVDVFQIFSEVNWRSLRNTSQVWLQFLNRSIDPNHHRELRAGVAWVPMQKITLSGQLTRNIAPTTANTILIQIRYRY